MDAVIVIYDAMVGDGVGEIDDVGDDGVVDVDADDGGDDSIDRRFSTPLLVNFVSSAPGSLA